MTDNIRISKDTDHVLASGSKKSTAISDSHCIPPTLGKTQSPAISIYYLLQKPHTKACPKCPFSTFFSVLKIIFMIMRLKLRHSTLNDAV